MVISIYKMEFKRAIEEIGGSDADDASKREKTLQYIINKYAEKSRPVKASQAKKILLANEMIGRAEAELIKFSDITKKVRDEREEKLQNQEPIEVSEEVFDALRAFKNSKNSEEVIIFLMLASGLRFNEVFDGEFYIEKKTLYIRQVSKRTDDKTDFAISLLFVSAKEFMELLDEARKNSPSFSATIRRVNRRLKKFGLSSHKMRGLFLFYHLNVKKTGGKRPVHLRVKKLLHHQTSGAGEHYESKVEVAGLTGEEMVVKTNSELRAMLVKRGFNKENTKGFNRLTKKAMLNLLRQ